MVTIVQTGPIEQSVRIARQLAVVAVRTLDRALLAGFEKLYLWQERARQRHQLADMTEHMRADLGLSRAEIDYEAGKPFWIN
jgi:uncharacterized protein YjiS (DUF1127 family)